MHTQPLSFPVGPIFNGTVSLDDGPPLAVTLHDTDQNHDVGPLEPTFQAPYTVNDLADALDAGTVFGEYDSGNLRLKRPPLPNTAESTNEWLATVTLPTQ